MKGKTVLTGGVIITFCFVLKCSTAIPIYKGKEIDKGEIIDSLTVMIEEIEELRHRVTNLEVKQTAKTGEISTLSETIRQNNYHRRKRALTRRRRRPEVAFQASLTKPSATLSMLDNINFNNVITNIGNAYSQQTGVFTAPVTGTYIFNTNIVAETGHYVEASIKVNDKVVVSAISDHRVSADGNQLATWDQGNAAAILRLNKGEKVAVSIQWPQKSIVIHGLGKSSFSGYLLRAY